MPNAQEDYETLNEILTRAGFDETDKESFIQETMEKLGYKLKRIFLDDDSQQSKGPRRIGNSTGGQRRVSNGSQYSDS